MKRILIAMVAVTVVAMAGSAIAAGQTRIDISAKVVGTCKFKSASTSIDIAELPFDPDSGAPCGLARACLRLSQSGPITAGSSATGRCLSLPHAQTATAE